MLSWLQDREPKSRPSNRSHAGHKEGVKYGGGAPRDHSSRSKSSESGHGHQHHGNRHRGGNGSLDSSSNTSNSSSKSDSKIWSSNRFERLELDPDHENFSTSLELATSGENFSKSSPSTSSTSLSSSVGYSTSASSTVSSSSSHKASGEDRRPGKGRGGKGSGRGRGLSKFQEPGSDSGGRSVGHPTKERDTGKEEGTQRKRSPKQIKFDLPASADGKDQEQVGRRGASPDPSKGDATSSNGMGGNITSESKTRVSRDRIIYDRVSSHVSVVIIMHCWHSCHSTGDPAGLQILPQFPSP